jgi:AcrR family transcriptional regulator
MTVHLPQDQRRKQILEAARGCMIARGYHASSIGDIARAAGLSKGGLYFHFPSKRDLFEALLREEFEASMGVLRGVNRGGQPLLEKLTEIGFYYLKLFVERNELARFRVVIGEMAVRDAEVRETLLEMNRAYQDEITDLIGRGAAEGELRGGLDARAVARLLIAMIDGLQEQFALQAPDDADEIERLVRAAIGLLWPGLRG